MRNASPMRAIPLVAIIALVVGVAAAYATTQSARAKLGVRSTSIGRVLTDQRGRTLYLFLKDTKKASMCSGSCASFWPPLVTRGKPSFAKGVRASLIGMIRRTDGRMQVTYRGHPVYTFKLDTKPGQTRGEGLSDFGARWYAVSPAGTKLVNVTQSGGSGSGSGYPSYGPRR
jgi:predicted lipoprotein with Yx(FWY)xxD motif